MQTEIFYRDITKTEALENFLLEKTESALESFLKNDPEAHLIVRVQTERHRTYTRKPVYKCEIILKPSHTRGVMKVVKQDADFYECVNKSVLALKAMLRRRSDRFHDHRRHDPLVAA